MAATRESAAPGIDAVLRKAMRLQSATYTPDDNATVNMYVEEILTACGMPKPEEAEAKKEREAREKEAEKATAAGKKSGLYST